MSALKVKSKMTNEKDSKQEVTVKRFKITDIPDVMEEMGWSVSASFMRKWFNDPYYEMTLKGKLNKIDMNAIAPSHIIQDLNFDEWLMKCDRVSDRVNDILDEVKKVRIYNGFLGQLKQFPSKLSPGLLEILSCLDRLGFVSHEENSLKNCFLDYSLLSAVELDKKTQFNYVKIGSTTLEKATDELDDVYGALGSFIIKFAFTNLSIERDFQGFTFLKIQELGLYVRDTYEFMNDGDDQLLGYWGWNGVEKPSPFEYLMKKSKITRNGKVYFRVTNGSFVQYREKIKSRNLTGDFFVYSKVKLFPVDIFIPISSIDIMEYLDVKGVIKK